MNTTGKSPAMMHASADAFKYIGSKISSKGKKTGDRETDPYWIAETEKP